MLSNEKRPYRSVDFNDERKWKTHHEHDDVYQVGTQKSIGYVIVEFNEDDLLQKMKLDFKEKFTHIVRSEHFYVFWVGDKEMMQSILDYHQHLLAKSNWPLDAHSFFERVVTDDVYHDKDSYMYHLIAKLFNSWCLWCELPGQLKLNPDDNSGTYLSRYPYDPDVE